ncbi:protocadherin-like wing polarity protein stan [Trichonephila clavipes]|nr:protocadherin-like wing polarity protein stan [Trichonephila clavipes]
MIPAYNKKGCAAFLSRQESITDGVNEVQAEGQLRVRLVSEAMLFNSVTVRLDDMTQTTFLSPLFDFFVEGLAAILPCPKENIFVFNVQKSSQEQSSSGSRIPNARVSLVLPVDRKTSRRV